MLNVPAGAAILLAFIRQTETGRKDASAYNTIYGHNENKLAKPITSMTVDEIIAAGPSWTKAYRSSAAGDYQFMNATLKDLTMGAIIGLAMWVYGQIVSLRQTIKPKQVGMVDGRSVEVSSGRKTLIDILTGK